MGYGTVARLFHWGTVGVVAILIPVGLIMVEDIPRAIQNPLFVLHKGLGSVFLALLLVRIGWRLFNPPPPLPADVSKAQAGLAELVHLMLYVLLLIMAVSGYVRVTTGGFPIEWLRAVGIPPLLPKMETVSKLASNVHEVTKTLLIGLILVHVGAAAWHGMVRRDGLLARMWPPFAGR